MKLKEPEPPTIFSWTTTPEKNGTTYYWYSPDKRHRVARRDDKDEIVYICQYYDPNTAPGNDKWKFAIPDPKKQGNYTLYFRHLDSALEALEKLIFKQTRKELPSNRDEVTVEAKRLGLIKMTVPEALSSVESMTEEDAASIKKERKPKPAPKPIPSYSIQNHESEVIVEVGTPKELPHKRKGGSKNRQVIMGFAAGKVVQWMSFNGWTINEARAVLKTMGFTLLEVSLRTSFNDGKNPKCSKPAPLTASQIFQLTELRKGVKP